MGVDVSGVDVSGVVSCRADNCKVDWKICCTLSITPLVPVPVGHSTHHHHHHHYRQMTTRMTMRMRQLRGVPRGYVTSPLVG